MTAVALTVTLVDGPEPNKLGTKEATVSVQLPSASNGWTATGIAIPVDTWFNSIKTAHIDSVDAYADQQYKFGIQITNSGATPASDLILTAHYSTTAGGGMTAVPTDTDMSAVGALQITIVGR